MLVCRADILRSLPRPKNYGGQQSGLHAGVSCGHASKIVSCTTSAVALFSCILLPERPRSFDKPTSSSSVIITKFVGVSRFPHASSRPELQKLVSGLDNEFVMMREDLIYALTSEDAELMERVEFLLKASPTPHTCSHYAAETGLDGLGDQQERGGRTNARRSSERRTGE
eukprot:1168726-Rhodomonas_salina.1